MSLGRYNLKLSSGLIDALVELGRKIQSCRIDERRLPWCPMLPYVYPEYGKGKRIFYVGQDTFGWDLKMGGEEKENCFDFFFDCYDRNDFKAYLEHNSKALTLDRRIYGWPNKPGSFWFGINSLHLKLTLNRDPMRGLRDLSDDELTRLNGIGYGNLNSIELPKTLRKSGNDYWSMISQDEYRCIKNNSNDILDKLKYLLKAFRPDCVVIASWTGKSEAEYLEGCDVTHNEKDDGVLTNMKVLNYTASFEGVGTKVFWTKHPSKWGWSWSKFAMNVNELAGYINKSMRW